MISFRLFTLVIGISCRGGAGPRGALPTLSQYMLSSAATFGFFLSIGSVCLSFTLLKFSA